MIRSIACAHGMCPLLRGDDLCSVEQDSLQVLLQLVLWFTRTWPRRKIDRVPAPVRARNMSDVNVGQFDFSGASRCNQGATFIETLTFFNDAEHTDPQVLTGLEFRMQVRVTKDAEEVACELISDGLDPEGDAPVNGTITLGDDDDANPDNRLTMRIEASQTELLEPGTYRYDIESVSSDVEPLVTRLFEGRFTVNGEVTRAV